MKLHNHITKTRNYVSIQSLTCLGCSSASLGPIGIHTIICWKGGPPFYFNFLNEIENFHGGANFSLYAYYVGHEIIILIGTLQVKFFVLYGPFYFSCVVFIDFAESFEDHTNLELFVFLLKLSKFIDSSSLDYLNLLLGIFSNLLMQGPNLYLSLDLLRRRIPWFPLCYPQRLLIWAIHPLKLCQTCSIMGHTG